jgi:hypothetical protein
LGFGEVWIRWWWCWCEAAGGFVWLGWKVSVRALALDSGCAHGGHGGCSRGGGGVGSGGILSMSLSWLILLCRSILLSHLQHVHGYEVVVKQRVERYKNSKSIPSNLREIYRADALWTSAVNRTP